MARKTVNGVVYELKNRQWIRVGGKPHPVGMTAAERDQAGLRADQRGTIFEGMSPEAIRDMLLAQEGGGDGGGGGGGGGGRRR